jgi:Mg2+/Co2+ transporter CorB
MRLNRYRLRHKSKAGHRGARLAEKLLAQPDRLIGLILLGNNLVNVLASQIVAVIAYSLGGTLWFAASGFILTFVILIFSEVTPKTIAALHPEGVAFPAAFIYYPLLKVSLPFRGRRLAAPSTPGNAGRNTGASGHHSRRHYDPANGSRRHRFER